MSPMPLGWSVGVDGTRVVVRVSGRPDDWFWLSTAETKSLTSQLRFARLIAHRRELAELDPEALAAEVRGDIDAHLHMYGPGAIDELMQEGLDDASGEAASGDDIQQRSAQAEQSPSGDAPSAVVPDGSRGLMPTDDTGYATTGERGGAGLPKGWVIQLIGNMIRFEVPASAADGEFQISRLEAAAVGGALLRLSAPAQSREELMDSEIASPWRTGRFGVVLPQEWADLFDGIGTDFSDEERGSTE